MTIHIVEPLCMGQRKALLPPQLCLASSPSPLFLTRNASQSLGHRLGPTWTPDSVMAVRELWLRVEKLWLSANKKSPYLLGQ